MALYVHYLYVLGKITKQVYPPRMTAHQKSEAVKFEMYKEQFQFLREHNLKTELEVNMFNERLQTKLKEVTKQRTVLNVSKKRKQNCLTRWLI